MNSRTPKPVFTTKPDPANEKPRDLVQRRFTADALRRLWVADVTYVAMWSGFAYVAFVADVFSRRIVGWNVASTLKADILPMQALNMAAWAADGNLAGLVHHADHGRTTSLWSTPLGSRNSALRRRREPRATVSIVSLFLPDLARMG